METQQQTNQQSPQPTEQQVADILKNEKKSLVISYVWKIALLLFTFIVSSRVPFVGSYVDALIDYVLGLTKYAFYLLIIFILISVIFHLPTEKVIRTKKFAVLISIVIFSIACMTSGIIGLVKYPTETPDFITSMNQYHDNWVKYFFNWKYTWFVNSEFMSGGILAMLVSYAFFFVSYIVLFLIAFIILLICVFVIFNINYRSTKVGLRLRGWMVRKLGGTLKTEQYDELSALKENQNKVKRVSNRIIRKFAYTNDIPPFDLLPYTDLSHYAENFKKARNVQDKVAKLFKSQNISATPVEVNVFTTFSEVCFEVHNQATIKKILSLQEQISKITKINNFNLVLKGHIICIEYTNFYFSKVSLHSASKLYDRRKYYSSFVGLNKENKLVSQYFPEEHHALIVGNRGSGSLTLSVLMILSMCYTVRPSDLELIILNPNAEAAYLNFTKLPHTDHKDYDDINKCNERLVAFVEMMRQRISLLSANRADDIDEYNRKVEREDLKLKHVLVVLANVEHLLRDSFQNQDIINNLIINGPRLGIYSILHSYDVNKDIMDDKIFKEIDRKYILKLSTENESITIFDNLRGYQLHSVGDCLTFAKLTRFMERIQLCNINAAELVEDVDIIKTFYEAKEEGRKDVK